MASKTRKKLDDARRIFEGGGIAEAAALLGTERRRVLGNSDMDGVAACDDYIAQMREWLSDDQRRTFDAALEAPGGAPDDELREEGMLSPVGLALSTCGAALMIVAVFLPRVEARTFSRIAQNTLIQSGDGWIFIGLAIGIAGATYRAFHKNSRSPGPMILGLVGIGVAIFDGLNKSSLRLCPTAPDIYNPGCETAQPGIGIYAAGVGALLAVFGGWQIWKAKTASATIAGQTKPASAETKTCPDCAETVLAPARVCKHCGFRFGAEEASAV
jgi:hypothetical protein